MPAPELASEEAALLAAVEAREPGSRLVYRDWLLDQGRCREAAAWGSDKEAHGFHGDSKWWWYRGFVSTVGPDDLPPGLWLLLRGWTPEDSDEKFRVYPSRLAALEALADAWGGEG